MSRPGQVNAKGLSNVCASAGNSNFALSSSMSGVSYRSHNIKLKSSAW